MRRFVSSSAGILIVYVALATSVFSTAWRAPTERWVGVEPDPILFIWHLAWMPFSIAHGDTPFVSNYLAFPGGFNLLWNTSILLPAFVLSPVTALFGAIAAYNVLSTLALALSGWCAYLAFRRYVRPEAAAIGGLLYGFSPFMFAQAADHAHMTLAVFPPLALLLLDEVLVRQTQPARRMGFLLGVASALQLLTGEEILAATVLVAGAGIVLLALLNRSEIRRHAGYAARAFAVAAVVALAIAAYPLTVQFERTHGASASVGEVRSANSYVVDALEFVVPTARQELTFSAANRLGAKFAAPSEVNGYVGLPLLLLTAFVVITYRRDRLVRVLGGVALFASLLALGPRLNVAGHSLPVPLPWVIPQRLPLLVNMLPARLTLFTFLVLGLLVALFVDRIRLPRLALVAILAAVFAPLIPKLPYPSSNAESPAFFESGAGRIPNGSAALVVPIAGVTSGTARPMLWQALSDFRYRMPGGYVRSWRGSYAPEVAFALDYLGRAQQASASPTPAVRRELRCALRRLGVRTVIVGPQLGSDRVVALFRDVLGNEPISTGGVELWPGVLVSTRRGAGGCA